MKVYWSEALRFFTIKRITNSVPTVSKMPMGKQIHAIGIKPAIKKQTKEIAATVIAYGSCVET